MSEMIPQDVQYLFLFVSTVIGALIILGFMLRVAVGLLMWLVDKVSGDA